MDRKQKLIGILWLVRVPALMILALYILTVLVLCGEFSLHRWLCLSVTPVLLYAGAYVFNDAMDADIDIINLPHRPIPSGRVTRQEAFWMAAGLYLLSVLSAIGSDVQTVVYVCICGPGSLWYSLKGKQIIWLKNISVAILNGLIFIYLAEIVSDPSACWYLFIVNLFLMLGREIIMDARDIKGDFHFGVPTLASRFGDRIAAILGLSIIGIGMIWAVFADTEMNEAIPRSILGILAIVVIGIWIFLFRISLQPSRRLWLIAESVKIYMVLFPILILWNRNV